MKNLLKTRWQEGVCSIGAWVNLPDIHISETLARMGAEWLCFDLQHGLMSYSHLLTHLPAIDGTQTTPLVRVESNDAASIGRALDAGAHGVIVPMVNTAEEAAYAVTACRYPPDGRRSCGPMRGAMLEGFEYLATANDQIACIVMIETGEGLKNVEAIARTPGLDAIFIGPMDLCYGIGVAPGAFDDPTYIESVSRIKKACRANKIAIGMFGYDPQHAKSAVDGGFDFVSAGTDTSFFRAGVTSAFTVVRGEEYSKSRGGY